MSASTCDVRTVQTSAQRVIVQWQQGQRAGVGEAFVGGVGVRALRGDVGDHGGLVVLPVRGFDAELFAHQGVCAVRRHDQSAAQHARGTTDLHTDLRRIRIEAHRFDLCRTEQFDIGKFSETRRQRLTDDTRRRDIAERRHAFFVRIETRGAEMSAVADLDAPDRRTAVRQRRPQAHGREDALRTIGQRDAAFIVIGLRAGRERLGLDQTDTQRLPAQRTGQARADQAAADNQDVVIVCHFLSES